jgi:hypothetical protein
MQNKNSKQANFEEPDKPIMEHKRSSRIKRYTPIIIEDHRIDSGMHN